jgi:hypothetical protein
MRFWKRQSSFDLETELRRNRPEPRPEFVAIMAERVRARSQRRVPALRLAFVAVLTASLLVPLAAFGGFHYASSGTKSLIKSLSGGKSRPVTAARDQYAGEKCLVEHRTGNGSIRVIFVNPHAVPAHRRHGDTVIVCPAP